MAFPISMLLLVVLSAYTVVESVVLPYPYSVTIGDSSDDTRLHLATSNVDGNSISILLGNGDGTFQKQNMYKVGDTPTSEAVGDFNNDAKLDLAVSNAHESSVSILLGNGDGTFQNQTTYEAGLGSCFVTVGDFNNDAKPDLAVANSSI